MPLPAPLSKREVAATASRRNTWFVAATLIGGVVAVLVLTLLALYARGGSPHPLVTATRGIVAEEPPSPRAAGAAALSATASAASTQAPAATAPVSSSAVAGGGAGAVVADPRPELALSAAELRSKDAWAAGQTDLQACFNYQTVLAGRGGVRLRIAHTADRAQPAVPDAAPTVLNAANGQQCSVVPASGAVAPGDYFALFSDEMGKSRGEYAFTIAPQRTATPAPRFRPGEPVRANTPHDCLVLRVRPVAADSNSANCLADGSHVRVLDGPSADGGALLWRVTAWNGAEGTAGWARDDYLVASPDCDRNRTSRWCDTAVATATPPPRTAAATPANGTPAVAGDWSLIDYIRYETGAGQQFSFSLHLDQQGTHITGASAQFTLAGDLSGRTLRASYRQGGDGGVFVWTFTADGARFEGAFSHGSTNGGASYGRRIGVAVSGADQATITLIGPGVSGDTVQANGELYICFTVSRRSSVTLTGLVGGNVFYQKDDDGAGDCLGPYSGPPANVGSDGRSRCRIDMSVNGSVVAQATTSVLVTR